MSSQLLSETDNVMLPDDRRLDDQHLDKSDAIGLCP